MGRLVLIILTISVFALAPQHVRAQSTNIFSCSWNSLNACGIGTESCNEAAGERADFNLCATLTGSGSAACNSAAFPCLVDPGYVPPTGDLRCSEFVRLPEGQVTTTTNVTIIARGCVTGANYTLEATRQEGGTISLPLSRVAENQYSSTIGLLPIDRYAITLRASGNIVNQLFFTVTPEGGTLPTDPPVAGDPAGGTAGLVQQGTACPSNHISTAIGCIPLTDVQGMTKFFLQWAIGIAGGVALLLIGFAAYRIATSQGDPRRLQGGQELLLSAIGGLLMVVLSIYLLRFIGVNILGLF